MEDYEKILSEQWRVEKSPNETLAVHSVQNRVYIHSNPETKLSLLIDYSDIEFVKNILVVIANTSEVTIDNDFGTVLPGDEFVTRCKAEPNWNWRL